MKAAKGTEGVVLSLPQSGQRAVSLPTASLKKAAEGELSLTLKLTNATLRLDSKALEALASQAGGKTVELRYRVISDRALNGKQKKALGQYLEETDSRSSALLFALSAVSGDDPIRDLKGGTVQLNVPFARLPGTETGSLKLWRLEEAGGMTGYDLIVSDDALELSLDTLGEFGVVLEMPVQEKESQPQTQPAADETQPQSAPQQPAPQSPDRGLPLWLPIAGGVCLLLALALLITRKYWWK